MKYIPKYQRGKDKLPILPTYANVQSAQDNTKVYQDPINPLDKDKANRDAEQKNAWRKPVNTNVPKSEQIVTNLKGLGDIAYHTLKMPAQAGALALSMQMAAPLATTSLAAPSLSTLLTHTGIGMMGAIGMDHMYNEMGGKPMGEAFDVKNPIGRFAANLITPGGLAGMSTATPKAALNIKSTAKPINLIVNEIDQNLKDLEYIKNYYSKYNYEIPENLVEIAKDSKKTDQLMQKLINQHNTFVRGISTNWDEINKRNPEILRHLEGKGIDWQNNPQAAAEYMATHVPIQTGYGRAGLNKDFFALDLDGIYTSNSIPTAEGYTYGNGYIVKVKLPTNFTSKNRIDWVHQNELNYYKYKLPEAKVIERRGFSPKRKLELDKNLLKTEFIDVNKSELTTKIDQSTWGEVYKNIIPLIQPNNVKRRHFEIDVLEVIDDARAAGLSAPEARNKAKEYVKQYISNMPKSDGYAHYIHLGKPGEQLLEVVESTKITPEIWKNKSRAHTNVYSKGLSAGSLASIGISIPFLNKNK